MAVKELVSPAQVARAIGVSESSLKRWCDDGRIPMIRTAGGHRRLPIHGVLKFLRENDHALVDPEVLGLPRTSGQGNLVTDRARTNLREALVRGDEAIAQQVVVDLYLAQLPLYRICDEVVAKVFEDIGEMWACHDVAVYQERRGCEIALRVLLELRSLLTTPDPKGPVAIGGTISGDTYTLPTTIVEVVLREAGWRATSLGTSLPFETLERAILDNSPDLFWLSVSHLEDEASFLEGFRSLSDVAARHDVRIVLGGRALHAGLRSHLTGVQICDTFRELHEIVANARVGRVRADESAGETTHNA